ncbi:uncharacterized protein TM35_000051560 [Trypanosoma theileri]|uniref:Uncharacterized protein n=1 Tax=Trypanosoma theileri TaxID=67003 RepID=A0A1X0P562_9TRYP|nr:uncharacterized protein TM35_000051560 [Trypanosoma theileri]ORC91560.1 hypothetical protein TM35_000051560 [Trypanosoma theileri]
MYAIGRRSPAVAQFPSLCSLSADAETNAPSSETSFNQTQTVEDRFIGVANYREFLHDPQHLHIHSTDSLTELRYRKTLESRMGLGGGGLMFFHVNDNVNNPLYRDTEYTEGYVICHDALNPMEDSAEIDNQHIQPQSQQRQQQHYPEELGDQHIVGSTMMMMMNDLQDGFHTPPSSPMRRCREYPLIESTKVLENTTINSPINPMMGARSEVRDGYHTPLPHSRVMGVTTPVSRSPGTYGETNSTPGDRSFRGDNNWRTPIPLTATTTTTTITGGFPTPIYGSKCNDTTSNYTATPNPGRPTSALLVPSPQLRTPVKHENDLLGTPSTGVHGNNVSLSLNGSPVPRRSVLYSRHTTPRRRTETCHCVLNAEGLSLTDVKGRPNFSPLCWGYLGAIIALTNSVYLWREQKGAVTLFLAPPPFGFVSAVSASRHPTDTDDVYTAIGLTTGMTVIIRHHVESVGLTRETRRFSEVDFSFEKSERAVFRDYASHISTLQILGHQLYSGFMNGIFTVRNLRDGSLLWQISPFSQSIEKPSNYSRIPDCVVDVGAPIYKAEVTPDGEHIAVGTSDSLFVYHSSCIGRENRKKRRVVLTNSNRPVRAFCWWGFPYNCVGNAAMDFHSTSTTTTTTTATTPITSSSSSSSTVPNASGSTINGSGRQCFLQTVLIYSGGVDGSILSVYSVGGRSDKATCRFSAPILSILSSETSEEILVSLDTPNVEAAGGVHTNNTHHINNTIVNTEEAPLGDTGGDGLRVDNNWNSYDPSSDDESPQQVLYVDQHHPVDTMARNSRNDQYHPHGGGNRQFHTLSGLRFAFGTDMITPTTITTTTTTTNTNTNTTARPPMPRLDASRGSTQGKELLLILRLKNGGDTLERLNGFTGTLKASQYMALSPDNSLLFTTGSEMKMRLWRAFKARTTENVAQCEMR